MGSDDARLGLRLLELQREFNELHESDEFAASFGFDRTSNRAEALAEEYAATLRRLLSA